jgi:hypothetical protein
MARRMSCSITIDAVRDRTKTVTRRHVDTWVNLAAGDRLTLIEKGMGLPKGARQVVIAQVEIVDVTIEPLFAMTDDDCAAEGFPDLTADEFIAMWLASHRVPAFRGQHEAMTYMVRRIEWRYAT